MPKKQEPFLQPGDAILSPAQLMGQITGKVSTSEPAQTSTTPPTQEQPRRHMRKARRASATTLAPTEASEYLSNNSNDALKTPSVDDIIQQRSALPNKRANRESEQLVNADILALMVQEESNEAVVRLNIEVTKGMHYRIKRYCFEHNVKSLRVFLTVLIDAFLKERGY